MSGAEIRLVANGIEYARRVDDDVIQGSAQGCGGKTQLRAESGREIFAARLDHNIGRLH